MVSAKIRGGEQLRRTARALREAERTDLRREMTAAIRKAGQQTINDLKHEIESLPMRGFPKPGARRPYLAPTPRRGTRRKISNAVRLIVKTAGNNPAVTLTVDSSRLPQDIRNLPRKFDDPAGFRHPVQGNMQVWVRQQGKQWWWPTIQRDLDRFRNEIDDGITRVVEKLEAS